MFQCFCSCLDHWKNWYLQFVLVNATNTILRGKLCNTFVILWRNFRYLAKVCVNCDPFWLRSFNYTATNGYQLKCKIFYKVKKDERCAHFYYEKERNIVSYFFDKPTVWYDIWLYFGCSPVFIQKFYNTILTD